MDKDIIDDRGNLFGRVNVIDALAVLLLVAVVVAGTALVLPSGAQSQSEDELQPTTATVQVTVAPYVADAITTGPAPADDVYAVQDVTVTEHVQANRTRTNGPDTLRRLELVVTLGTETRDDGLLYFRDDRLYVGRTLTLDLGTTIVDGIVIELEQTPTR